MGITEMSNKHCGTFTLELFQNIFKCIEPEVQIDAFEEAQGSGRGDNYTATLYRVRLTGQRKCMADGGKKQKWEKNLICKRLPDNVKRREAYKSDKLFRNEVQFYTAIMPELLKFLGSKTNETFKAMPKCYFAQSDLLIMEDLCIRGFRMPDRKKGLTLAEVQLVLMQVAQFHALSLAYKFEQPKQFEAMRELTAEGLFCASNESWYKNYYERLTKNAINMMSEVFAEDSKYLSALKEFADSAIFSRMVNLANTESKLSAICHGDCWSNNFLYRDENKATLTASDDAVLDGLESNELKVLEVCLVDFQLIRYSSISLDIANILFCCTSQCLRNEHLDSLIELYTSEAYKWLSLLCTNMPEFCNTLGKFQNLFAEELKCFGRFALGFAMDIIPISTCSKEDAPDMYVSTEETEVLGAPELNFPPNDLCRQKMSEIVIEMVDRGML